MTPIELIDEMIAEHKKAIGYLRGDDIRYQTAINALEEAKERINKECTIELSTSDNTYNIPYGLVEEFEKDNLEFEEFGERTDSWYELCDKFDSKYSQYQV